MKNPRNFVTVVCMLLLVSIFQGQEQVRLAENAPSALPQKNNLDKDSVSALKIPTPEDLDNLDVGMAKKLTALRYDPSTKKIRVNYPFDNTGLVVELTLYYNDNRLIRVEKYIYDQNKKQDSYSFFCFDEKNGCFCNTQWNLKDANKRVLTMSPEYGLVYFGSNMQLIKMKPNKMQQFLQETKDSLDALMGHFKNFKYTFDIR